MLKRKISECSPKREKGEKCAEQYKRYSGCREKPNKYISGIPGEERRNNEL